MKKLLTFILILFVIGMIAGVNKLNNSARLPADGNSRAVQSARYPQLYDGDQTSFSHLSNGTVADTTKWDVTNDVTKDSLLFQWAWVDTARSEITQQYEFFANAIRNSQSLLLTYTVYDSTTIAGGTVSMWVDGICDSTAMSVTAGVAQTLALTSGSSASTADFSIWIKADGDVTAGAFSLDNLILSSYYESPVTIATGSDITLTIPTNAIELILDPQGTDCKVEIGSAYRTFNTLYVVPCSGLSTIKIANDSGSTATLQFHFGMI